MPAAEEHDNEQGHNVAEVKDEDVEMKNREPVAESNEWSS